MTEKQFAKYLSHTKGGEIGRRRGWFVAIPRLLNYIPSKYVSPGGKAVYRGMCALCSAAGSVRASYAAIAGETGVSRLTVIRQIPKLVTAGLVKVISTADNNASLYRVLFPSEWPREIVKAARAALEAIGARKLAWSRGARAAQRDDDAVHEESDEW